jgi:hypothetical protein
MGKPYEFKEEPPRTTVDEANKLEILNMSFSNKWFIFYNRKTEKMYVY